MKQGWELKTLGDVCEIMNGGTPDTTVPKFWDGENLWITPKDMGKLESIYVDNTLRKITDEGLKNSSAKILPPNSIILSSRAPIGHLAINTKPMSTNQGCKGLVPKKGIDTLFLYYFLSKSVELLNSLGTGATFKELSSSKLGTVEIPIPPLPEQQRIVAVLYEAFAAIAQAKANAEQNLKNAKELFESYLQGVFENGNENWEVNCLDVLGTITSSKRIYKSEYVKDGVPFYRTKEIKELSNGKPITLELFISRERYEQIKQSFGVPKIGDLLMSAVGTIGEIMVIENEDEFYFKDGNIVWFKDFEKLDTNYLKYALTAFVEKIKSLAIGAAYSALTIEKLNKYQIAFPSTIDEQQTIVSQLDALRTEMQKLEAVYQKKIVDLEELKKSILQKAFAGELKTEKALAI